MHFSQRLLVNLKQAKVFSFYGYYPSRLSWQDFLNMEDVSRCRTWHFLLNSMRFLTAHLSSMSKSLWMAAGPSGESVTTPTARRIGWGEDVRQQGKAEQKISSFLFIWQNEFWDGLMPSTTSTNLAVRQSLARINRLPNLKENVTKAR